MSLFSISGTLSSLAGTAIKKWLNIKPTRSFGGFSGFVSLTETHNHEVELTQYPIEDGTQGTDHVIKRPVSLQWEVIWGEADNPETIFKGLLNLQESGEPFTAQLGLKTYENMILTGISVTQDHHTGRVLRASLSLQQIQITAPVATTLPARSAQKNAKVTASTAKAGKKTTTSVTGSSAASKIADKVKKKSDLAKMRDSILG